jgi:Rrf2 family iron-sulfur cluster assembly transcriptional regulator
VRPFTRSTEYAIRALAYLALERDGGKYHLARGMSEVLGIPAPFLGKILQPLVMRGILESQRGRNGGFRLCSPPEEISLMHIADSQELVYETRQCFLGQAECSDERACPMHEYWKVASENFTSRMSSTTLMDLVKFCETSKNSDYPRPESLDDEPSISLPPIEPPKIAPFGDDLS